MANFNSTASQILNWTANFLNWVSNAARDVVVNPFVDLWALAAKWVNVGLDKITWQNLAKEANAKIDKAASEIKWEWNIWLKKQPEDPTSMAYAVWEWLTRWVDQAAAVLTLAEAAKQLPKVAQAGWKKILSKVSSAKTKNEQMKLAKEARDYINQNATNTIDLAEDVPAYQRRAVANAENAWRSATDPKVEKFTWQYYKDQSMKTFDNLTSKMKETDNVVKDWPKDLRKIMREWEVLDQIQKQDSSYKYLDPMIEPNRTYVNLSEEQASKLGVPYRKWRYWSHSPQEARDISAYSRKGNQWYTPSEIRAMEKDMAENVWSSAASKAVQEPDIFEEALLKEQTAQAKDLWTTVDTLKELAYSNNMTTKDFYDMIKKNAAKEFEEYMKAWETGEKFKQAMKKNKAKEKAFWKEADSFWAASDKKRIMDQYWISSKDYDEYANAAANTYIYIDKNWRPVNQMAWAGWPGGWEYFIDESKEVMPYLKWYARRHPTVDEYIRMAEEEAELGRLAEAEAADIAAEEAAYKHEGNPTFRL